PYAIAYATLSPSSNYHVTAFTSAGFAISTRDISLSADAGQGKTYGDRDPTLTYSVGGLGLANGDTEATAFTGGLHRASGESVANSPYAIDQASLAASSNYHVTAFT